MNSRFTLALGAVVVGACTTMAMQDGGLARADDPPAAASKAEVLALKNQVTQDIAALYYRVEQLEADRDELQATVAELEARSPGLGAYDAEGNWLGAVVDYASGDEIGSVKSVTAWHHGMGRPVRLTAGNIGGGLLFAEPNCAGTPYVRRGSEMDIGRIHHGNFYAPSGTPVDRVIVSYGLNSDCTNAAEPTTEDVYVMAMMNPPYPIPIVGPITVR